MKRISEAMSVASSGIAFAADGNLKSPSAAQVILAVRASLAAGAVVAQREFSSSNLQRGTAAISRPICSNLLCDLRIKQRRLSRRQGGLLGDYRGLRAVRVLYRILRRYQRDLFKDADAAAAQQICHHRPGEAGGVVLHANGFARLI